jgi:DNA-binding HxlR family transcriptional regulator
MSESDEPTIFDVIDRKGTIQIILEIGIGSATFDDIEENVEVSSSTVSTRLKEGKEAHIFEVKFRTTDHGTQKRYGLTDYGEEILRIIQEGDINNIVREYQTAKKQFEVASEMLINNVHNHDSLVKLNEYQSKPQDELSPMERAEDGLPEMIDGYLSRSSDIEHEKLAGWVERIEELEDNEDFDMERALQEIEETHARETEDDENVDDESGSGTK